MNDPDWRRPNMRTLMNGLSVDGFGNVLSGICGGFGMGVSSANVGLAMANRVSSRSIGFFTGATLIVLSFFPQPANFMAAIPVPVMGAILIYVTSILIVYGFELIMTRMLDNRRTAMIGLAFIAGMSAILTPELYRHTPEWIRAVFASPLSLAAIVAVLLNLAFKLGIRRTASLTFSTGHDWRLHVREFWTRHGATWGAFRDVIQSAEYSVLEIVESIPEVIVGKGTMTAEFDEFNLNIRIRYTSETTPNLNVSMPSPEEFLTDPAAEEKLPWAMIKQFADQIKVKRKDGEVTILLHFDH